MLKICRPITKYACFTTFDCSIKVCNTFKTIRGGSLINKRNPKLVHETRIAKFILTTNTETQI